MVWHDERAGEELFDIYGARVSAAGEVLDPEGVAISTAPDIQGNPDLAYNLGRYLVAWLDRRSGDADVYGARVTQDAELLDVDGLLLDDGEGFQGDVAVAGTGVEWLVSWKDSPDEEELLVGAARVLEDGTQPDGDGMLLSGTALRSGEIGVGTNPSTGQVLLGFTSYVEGLAAARLVVRQLGFGADGAATAPSTTSTTAVTSRTRTNATPTATARATPATRTTTTTAATLSTTARVRTRPSIPTRPKPATPSTPIATARSWTGTGRGRRRRAGVRPCGRNCRQGRAAGLRGRHRFAARPVASGPAARTHSAQRT